MANDLGLGITISINDAFSAPAERFKQSASGITGALNNIGLKTFVFNQIYEGANHVANALQMIVGPGQAFEQNLKELSAITGVTGAGLADIGERARQLAKDFGGSAKDAVESYKQVLSKLGPEIAKNPAALDEMGKSIATLSKTMSGDVLGATTALTTSMNIYAGQLTDPIEQSKAMVSQMNVMAAAAQVGSAEVPQIAQSIQVAGLTAKQAGLSFEELNSTIQVMGKGAIYGAEAGTALRNALQIMSQGRYMPKQAREGLEAAGISLDYLSNATIPISQRLKELSKIQGDSALVGEVFGRENSRAARTLFENLPLIDKWTVGISGTQSATEQAETVMGSFSEKMARMKARFEDIAISIFEATKPFLPFVSVALQSVQVMASLAPAGVAVSNIFQAISGWVSKGQVAAQTTQNLALAESNALASTTQRGFMESVAESAAVVPILATEMAVLNTEMAVLTTETGVAAGSNLGLAASTAPVTTGFMATATSIWLALAPLLPFIAAGVALVAVYKLVTSGISDFKEMAKSGTEPLTGIAGIFQKLGGVITGVGEIFNSWNGTTFELSANTKEALEKIGITEFVLALGTWIIRIKEFFIGIGAGIVDVYKLAAAVANALIEATAPLLNWFNEVVITMGFATTETDNWAAAGKILGWIIGAVLVVAVGALAVAMYNLAAGVIAATWPFIVIAAVITAVGFAIYEIIVWVRDIPREMAIAGEWFVSVWNSMKDGVSRAIDYIGQKWQDGVAYVKGIAGEFGAVFSNLYTEFIDGAKNLGNAIVDGIKFGLTAAWDGLLSMLTGLIAELPGGAQLLDFVGVTNNVPEFKPEGNPESNSVNSPMLAGISNSAVSKASTVQSQSRFERLENNNTTTESINVTLQLDTETIAKQVVNRNKMMDARGNF